MSAGAISAATAVASRSARRPAFRPAGARRPAALHRCYPSHRARPRAPRTAHGRVPNRHGLHRPPMYGEPGGLQGRGDLPMLLGQAGYTTQAVGKWASRRNVESQPQHVGCTTISTASSRVRYVHRMARSAFLPEIVSPDAHRVDQAHTVQSLLRARQEGRRGSQCRGR